MLKTRVDTIKGLFDFDPISSTLFSFSCDCINEWVYFFMNIRGYLGNPFGIYSSLIGSSDFCVQFRNGTKIITSSRFVLTYNNASPSWYEKHER